MAEFVRKTKPFRGPPGEQGEPGPPGPQGEKGEKGDIGETFSDTISLTNLDISRKAAILSSAPVTPSKTRLFVVGGGAALYGADFIVEGNVLTWNNLGLDSLLSVGDKIIVEY